MKVYKLRWRYDHLCNMDYDIEIIRFRGYENLDLERKLMNDELIEVPSPIHFIANFNTVKTLDFPVSKGLLVCSDKMLRTIEENNADLIIKYPVLLLDDQFLGNRYSENGSLNKQIDVLDNFKLIQPTEILQLIDLNASEYKEMKPRQLWPTIIYNLVLKEPKNGFPGIFRLKEKRSNVYINELVMNALIEAKVMGCIFEEIEVTPFSGVS